MFSGIVESTARVAEVIEKPEMLTISVERPSQFEDVAGGDSICTDGVCLTVEEFSAERLRFSLGAETLNVTGWTASELKGRQVNLERSLRFGDRIHGHLVTGHVDGVGQVSEAGYAGDSLILKIALPLELAGSVWKKGSVAINGVSLTVNQAQAHQIEVCLIPETLRRTNLQDLKSGDRVNIETDAMAKAMLRSIELKSQGVR